MSQGSTTDLGINITANDAGASASLGKIAGILQQIEAQSGRTGAAGAKAGHDVAGAGNAMGSASDGIAKFETHAMAASRALNVLGLQADAGAVKVGHVD